MRFVRLMIWAKKSILGYDMLVINKEQLNEIQSDH